MSKVDNEDELKDINKEKNFESLPEFYKERKCFQKIYVDRLFPSYVRPPSVLIGVKGVNHNKMQSSGCLVQLRGKGCSQPNASDADEPQHLLVKYNTEEQFKQFMKIFNEIVNNFKNQKLNRFMNNRRRGAQNNIAKFNKFQLNAEFHLIWMIRLLFNTTQSIPFIHLNETFCSFYQHNSMAPYLNNTGIPFSAFQLQQFISLCCPHIFQLVSPTGILLDHTKSDVWASALVVLNQMVHQTTKEQLFEIHRSVRVPSPETPLPCPVKDPLPMSTLNLILQALHFLISETNSIPFYMVKKRFLDRFKIPLVTTPFGYPNVMVLLQSFPQIFAIHGSDKDLYVEALTNPEFGLNRMAKQEITSTQNQLPPPDLKKPEPVPDAAEIRKPVSQPKLLGILGKLVKK